LQDGRFAGSPARDRDAAWWVNATRQALQGGFDPFAELVMHGLLFAAPLG